MSWPTAFTERQLQRVASGRLTYTPNRKVACEILVDAGLLELKSERKGPTKGRKREEYRVNPIVFGIQPSVVSEAPAAVPSIDQAA